jgi:hypothetical protein
MCCGEQRQKYRTANPRRILPPASATDWFRTPSVKFEYFGRTGLTVLGKVSGSNYRFEKPGFQVDVDARDASSLECIPNLRRAAPDRY